MINFLSFPIDIARFLLSSTLFGLVFIAASILRVLLRICIEVGGLAQWLSLNDAPTTEED